MTETDPILESRNIPDFADLNLTRREGEKVDKLSKLFNQLFDQSGFSYKDLKSLNVVIVGSSPWEIIGLMRAAADMGIEKTYITDIEKSRLFHSSSWRILNRVFDRKYNRGWSRMVNLLSSLGAGTRRDETLAVGNSTIRMILGDAAEPQHRQILSESADATMVFIGNSEPGIEGVFDNLTAIERSETPFLFALTSLSPDVKAVGTMFNTVAEREGLRVIINGARNEFALPGHMTHTGVFAAVSE